MENKKIIQLKIKFFKLYGNINKQQKSNNSNNTKPQKNIEKN